jgi:hypoxanthine phosphoribosyltransferase
LIVHKLNTIIIEYSKIQKFKTEVLYLGDMTFKTIDKQGISIDADIKKYLPKAQHRFLPEYEKTLAGVLIPEQEIDQVVVDCAKQISQDYQQQEVDKIATIYVLKGARKFMGKLETGLYENGIQLIDDIIGVSRYGTKMIGGVPRISVPETEILPNDHVLVVEDVLDQGLTLEYITDHLQINNPASIKLATLLLKPSKYQGDRRIHYPLFKVDDHWVVGMGMDMNIDGRSRYRELPFVAIANPDYLLETEQIDEKKADELRSLIH